MAAFALEDGETDYHHDLVRWLHGGQRITATLQLSDRRIIVVAPHPARGFFERMRNVMRTDRLVVEIRREDFARVTLFQQGIVIHARAGSVSPLDVVVDDPTLWLERVKRWALGDIPRAPLPSARLSRDRR